MCIERCICPDIILSIGRVKRNMWSKTKKALNDRMAVSLKKHVRYNFEVYVTNKYKWYTEMPVSHIYILNTE